jgi:hypothetical protein
MHVACKKGTASTTAFSGIYVEQDPTGSTLRLNFIGKDQVIVTGGKLNNQTWTATSDTFNLQLNSTNIFFIDPANSSNSAEYWYHLIAKDGANELGLSPCPPGMSCVEDYLFVQQP